jgi:hypothetical protein
MKIQQRLLNKIQANDIKWIKSYWSSLDLKHQFSLFEESAISLLFDAISSDRVKLFETLCVLYNVLANQRPDFSDKVVLVYGQTLMYIAKYQKFNFLKLLDKKIDIPLILSKFWRYYDIKHNMYLCTNIVGILSKLPADRLNTIEDKFIIKILASVYSTPLYNGYKHFLSNYKFPNNFDEDVAVYQAMSLRLQHQLYRIGYRGIIGNEMVELSIATIILLSLLGTERSMPKYNYFTNIVINYLWPSDITGVELEKLIAITAEDIRHSMSSIIIQPLSTVSSPKSEHVVRDAKVCSLKSYNSINFAKDGYNALCKFIENSSATIDDPLDALLENHRKLVVRYKPEDHDSNGNTILMLCAIYGHDYAFNELIEYATMDDLTKSTNRDGKSVADLVRTSPSHIIREIFSKFISKGKNISTSVQKYL